MRLLLALVSGAQQFFLLGGMSYAFLSLIAAVFWPPLTGYAVAIVALLQGFVVLITLPTSQLHNKWKMTEPSRGRYILSLLIETASFYGMLWIYHQYLRPLDLPAWRIVLGALILWIILSKVLFARLHRSYAEQMFDYRCRATREFLTMLQQSELQESIKANECIYALNTFKTSTMPLLGIGLVAFREGLAYGTLQARIGKGAIGSKKAIRDNPERALSIAQEFVRNIYATVWKAF